MIFTLTFVPLIAMVALIIQQSHLLITLLTLERLILSIILLIPLTLTYSRINLNTLRVILLSFGACEASLGLRLLVTISRTMGTDLVSNLTINKC